jgi:hypothetical protein
MRARLASLTLAGVAAGCAPTYHTPPAYRYDRPRSAALEQRAVQECTAAVGAQGVPPRTFVTDGCSTWPDVSWTGISWQECCISHDIAYWCGGPSSLREKADRELDACVSQAYGGWMGALMWSGTRSFGWGHLPAYWRWGYGHDYPASE